jgi:hypothetical protein
MNRRPHLQLMPCVRDTVAVLIAQEWVLLTAIEVQEARECLSVCLTVYAYVFMYLCAQICLHVHMCTKYASLTCTRIAPCAPRSSCIGSQTRISTNTHPYTMAEAFTCTRKRASTVSPMNLPAIGLASKHGYLYTDAKGGKHTARRPTTTLLLIVAHTEGPATPFSACSQASGLPTRRPHTHVCH